jgi:hypothetical protein
MAADAGISSGNRSIRLHGCRRTAIRNLVRAGVSDKVARTINGHKTRLPFDQYTIADENNPTKEMDCSKMLEREQDFGGQLVTKRPFAK